jgi:hypothetical protein
MPGIQFGKLLCRRECPFYWQLHIFQISRTEHVNINETIRYDYFRKHCLLTGETAYSASCN